MFKIATNTAVNTAPIAERPRKMMAGRCQFSELSDFGSNLPKTVPRSASFESSCTRRPVATSRMPAGKQARNEKAAERPKLLGLHVTSAPASDSVS